MKTNFISRYFDPVASAVGAAASMSNPVGIGLAAAQGAAGLIQSLTADAKLKRLLDQRTAYKTPEEIFKALNLTLSGAQGDTIARDFQTDQIDRTFSQIMGNATRLGGDPNDLSALFDQKIRGIMQVGDKFHASNMEGMSKVLSAYDVVASNKAAEWSSQQDILKDKMQAAAADKSAGIQNLGSAANAGIAISAASKTSNLYKQIADAVLALKNGQGTAVGAYNGTNVKPAYAPGQYSPGGIYGDPYPDLQNLVPRSE